MMGTECAPTCLKTKKSKKLLVPPGFASLTSFLLTKVDSNEENCGSTASKEEMIQMDTPSNMVDAATLKRSLKSRPWILYDQNNHNWEESESEFESESESDQPGKVTEGQYLEDSKADVLEEFPVFHPTEEEFSDTLAYIASIRLRAEPYGICRIVPPPSWQPPCLLKKENIWEKSAFVTRFQRVDGLQDQNLRNKVAKLYEISDLKRKRSMRTELEHGVENKHLMIDESGSSGIAGFESKIGPVFTLETFRKYADDFKTQYFSMRDKVLGGDNSNVFQKQSELPLEDIEDEYRRLVENPTEGMEVLSQVLYGDDVDTGVFGSGFPSASSSLETSDYQSYHDSGWNLNNTPRLPGSLLSLEDGTTSSVLVPRLHIGICFSSQVWKVEEHHLYLLTYMHLGAPKIWLGIPGRYNAKFEVTMRKCLQDLSIEQPDWSHRLVMKPFPYALKPEGIPVYRSTQNPGEFVLVFPGAYFSAFDCGFNCTEMVNFAPLDWLPHGQNAVEVYREQRKRTTISHDKLLMGAAREAVRAQWEVTWLRKSTPDNLKWKDACGADGMLTKALKSRIKAEDSRRKYLCSPSQSQRMDKSFDATRKMECRICFCDLHLSAACCSCSADRYSCLNHTKQLCFCGWSQKTFLFRYEISELDVLAKALEGKLSAVHRWAREDLKLVLHSRITKDCPYPGSDPEEPKQKRQQGQSTATSNGVGNRTVNGIKALVKAQLQQARSSREQKANKETVASPVALNGRTDSASALLRETTSGGASSGSLSVSTSSESEEMSDLGFPYGEISFSFQASMSAHSEIEVTSSQLSEGPSSKKNVASKRTKSSSKLVPSSHTASEEPTKKKRKK